MKDDYKLWYDEAITASNEYGFAGMSAEGVITYQGEENRLQANRIEELEDMLSRLVKENDLAMPSENYQWMYSPMRVECLKFLENK